ncbi:glucose oxidase [Cercophora newfieldiana]|uniref:Glucose oxidase n=1 Tax=Cercophora newfieldiana TaxID=92897 RepID=A0AA39XT75_9PEZI|nr:glucose oxidase [Cercophora newfieldiana]
MALWKFLLLHGASLTSGAILNPQEAAGKTYDYVIIGGGTSGLTVGDRLSKSGKHSVLVIDYGYFGQTTYNITSAPSPGLRNRTFPVDIGCVVGGSSAINGMVFQRGNAKDYNIWDELARGKNTWNWDSLLGYFKKAVQLMPPKPEIPADFNLKYDMKYWGSSFTTNHTIFATYTNFINPSIEPMYRVFNAVPGIDTPEDGGSGKTGMVYYMTSTNPYNGARSYSRTGHWDNLNRDNYDLLTGTRVNNIIFKGNTAVGVRITPRNTTLSSIITAQKEVILAAGSIYTPQILQLSGIGPVLLLKRAKIPVKVDLPGVGANFQDHSFLPEVSFRFSTPPPIPPHLLNQSPPNNLGRTSLGLSLPLRTISPTNFSPLAARFASQHPSAFLLRDTHPTIIAGYRAQQALYAREMLRSDFSAIRFTLTGTPSFQPITIHPVSRGTVLIDPEAPEGEPIVDYRAASNPIDVEIAVEGIKFLRRAFSTGELAGYNATEVVPGRELDSDEKLGEWVRMVSVPSVWGGLVDAKLRVYGVKQLSVVDASIFATIVAGTAGMSVYAVAEKAADLIKDRA